MIKMLSTVLIVILLVACSEGEANDSATDKLEETVTESDTSTDNYTEVVEEEEPEEVEEVVEEEEPEEELEAQEILDLTADEWLAFPEDERQVLMSNLIFELKQIKGWSFKYTDKEYKAIVDGLLSDEKGTGKTVSETMGLLMLMEGNK